MAEKTYEEFDYTMGSEEYKNADSEEKIKILNDKRNTVKLAFFSNLCYNMPTFSAGLFCIRSY